MSGLERHFIPFAHHAYLLTWAGKTYRYADRAGKRRDFAERLDRPQGRHARDGAIRVASASRNLLASAPVGEDAEEEEGGEES